MQDRLTSFFWSGDAIRSRSVGNVVFTATLDVPAPPARLTADWTREIARQLDLAPGDVEPLSLARARTRWPDYRRCVQAMADWTGTLGLKELNGLTGLLAASDIALMASRGASYHHDGAQYGSAAFCNLFLSEDKGLDVHFPATGQRIPLVRGTAMVFDTGQPHAVVRRGSTGFDAADFSVAEDCTQVFLTWELPIEDARLANALGVVFDTDRFTASRLTQEQVWVNGVPASVCPDSGRWRAAG
ncbi:MAG: hypothetical protein V4636_17405 [Pseudomonadota bacterium]